MSSLSSLSTEDIKKELEKREGGLSGLYARRDELEKELADVNEQIAAGGTGDDPAPAKKKRGRPPGSKNKPKAGAKAKTAPKKRPKNEKKLPAVLADILGGKSSPMSTDEIYEAVLETGYKTTSNNFRNVVYQNLYTKPQFEKQGGGWVHKG